jgi:hypothetical protein
VLPQPALADAASAAWCVSSGVVGRFATGFGGAVYGCPVSMVATLMAPMLMAVMGTAVVLAWRPTTRL